MHRIWRTFGLQPHRVDYVKLSTDPFFVEKVRDTVGLYLNPPDHAVVLCVDEKTQIQALERTQPLLSLGFGYVEGVTHDYRRHGTTTLFAALDTATGQVLTRCCPRQRHQEFLTFVAQVEASVPAELELHLITDNYATHKHAKIKAWLARHPRVHIHYTPTYASWLNQVEIWFSLITAARPPPRVMWEHQAVDQPHRALDGTVGPASPPAYLDRHSRFDLSQDLSALRTYLCDTTLGDDLLVTDQTGIQIATSGQDHAADPRADHLSGVDFDDLGPPTEVDLGQLPGLILQRRRGPVTRQRQRLQMAADLRVSAQMAMGPTQRPVDGRTLDLVGMPRGRLVGVGQQRRQGLRSWPRRPHSGRQRGFVRQLHGGAQLSQGLCLVPHIGCLAAPPSNRVAQYRGRCRPGAAAPRRDGTDASRTSEWPCGPSFPGVYPETGGLRARRPGTRLQQPYGATMPILPVPPLRRSWPGATMPRPRDWSASPRPVSARAWSPSRWVP